MKMKNRILSLLLALCLILSLLPAMAYAQGTQDGAELEITELDSAKVDLKNGADGETLENQGYSDDELVDVIVVLEQKSLLDQGYTKRQIAGAGAELAAAKANITAAQDQVIEEINAISETPVSVGYRYSVILSGFSVEVPYGTLKDIQKLDNVRSAFVAPVFSVPEDCTGSDVSTNTFNTSESFGSASTWQSLGYTGAGMRIAIVDTGLDTDHPSFRDDPALTERSLTAAEVAEVLPELNATARYSEETGLTLSSEDVYYSAKIPFGFNYGFNSLDVTHDNDTDNSDHGTHVAGIAAANAIEGTDVVGVAPDAQILVMKVFGEGGGASFTDIVAALEDCYRLNVDAINMSLGSDAGFTTIADEVWDEIFAKVADSDMIASVSAGNAGSAADYNGYGTDLNLTSDPDNGIVSSPASLAGMTMVASLENATNRVNYFSVGEANIAYTDAASDSAAFATLEGTLEYAMVSGYGSEEDFAAVDVKGRVAVVMRGDLAFTEKQTNAANAGAVACIVYDNAEGDLINMVDAGLIPNVFISKADGEKMAELATDGVGTLVIHSAKDMLTVENATGGQMSDFSSWGVTPDLELNPDVTAPGGYIFSSVNDGEYGIMSGTSMAAPHIAGMAALVLQYLHEQHADLSDEQMHTVAEALIMSTATPVMEDEGVEYSPRKQGAGAANVYDAIASGSYLTVNGSSPKVSMGDDDAKTGEYSFSFEINNFSGRTLSYELDASLLTDLVNTDYAAYGYLFMGETSMALSSVPEFFIQEGSLAAAYDVNGDGTCNMDDVQFILDAVTGLVNSEDKLDLNGDGEVDTRDAQLLYEAVNAGLTKSNVVQVKAGQSVSVTVRIALNEADRTYMETYYPNGIYVEGFVRAYALDEDNSDLSLPFLGFYGDWSAARVFDGGWYYDEEPEYNRYLNVLWTNYGSYYNYFGMNGYVDEAYDPAHNVVSPNDDTYNDLINDMYLSLMRGAKTLRFTYTDDATGEVLYMDQADWVRKSYYVSSAGVCYPFLLTDYFDDEEIYDFTDAEGNYLANNTKVTLTIDALLDDGDEIADETITVPITVDTEAPELLKARKMIDAETGEPTYLELTFRDNVAASVVALLNGDGTTVYAMTGMEDPEPAEDGSRTYTLTFDVSGMDRKLMIVLADYGMNESYFGVNLGGKGSSFGSLVAFQYDYDSNISKWVSFDSNVNKNETPIFTSDINFVCAEYVNGYVYAQTDSGALYGFAYDAMLGDTNALAPVFVAQLENVYQDLAYSYAEGKLYGLLTTEYEGYPTTEVYSINLNGAYYDSNAWKDVAPYEELWTVNRGGIYGLGMAVNDDGTIYILALNYDWDTEDLSATAHLWNVPMEYNEWYGQNMLSSSMTEIADTGLSMNYLQSMTWDHNAEKLYWARFDVVSNVPEQELVEINPETAECTVLGKFSGETYGMFAPLTESAASSEAHANVPAMDNSIIATPSLNAGDVVMNLGGTKQLTCSFDPWYSAHKSLVWTSSAPEVVSVDENGLITALGKGSATITVANAEDESLSDSCTVNVTALDLHIDGIFTEQTAGTGSTGASMLYSFDMVGGSGTFTPGAEITASEELNFGLSIYSSTYGRNTIWACECGNAGMIYQIDPESGEVLSCLEPVDGDHLYGMAYSEKLDSFTAVMDMYLYVDQPLTEDVYEDMLGSYDETINERTWHKFNMLPYLIESNNGFVTGEDNNGASSEVVFSGVTILDNENYYELNGDYMGNGYSSSMYNSDQTIVLMDNVGRLWYVDEIANMYYYADDWDNAFYLDTDFATTGEYDYTEMISAGNGVEAIDNGDGTYNVFVIREIVETPLTDMFREGTMPRTTYCFSDITYAGKTGDGANMFLISLYDYWNNGTTNHLYLYVEGVGTGEYEIDYSTWSYVEIKTPDQLYDLGTTGEHNIIATINRCEVTGGLSDSTGAEETEEVLSLTASVYKKQLR